MKLVAKAALLAAVLIPTVSMATARQEESSKFAIIKAGQHDFARHTFVYRNVEAVETAYKIIADLPPLETFKDLARCAPRSGSMVAVGMPIHDAKYGRELTHVLVVTGEDRGCAGIIERHQLSAVRAPSETALVTMASVDR